jgi:Fe-S-cluster containining protein
VRKLVQIGHINFRFECQPGCTNCCSQPGEVYLAPDDANRIAGYLGLSTDEFRSRCCEFEDGDLRLAGPTDGPCRFVEDGGCSIHEVKPLQCQAFPFWPENVRGRRAWRNLRRHCPGIGVGPLVPIEKVRADAQACLDAFPDL